MKLVRFMDAAYQGKTPGRKLKTGERNLIFNLEDLADQIGEKPSRAEVQSLVPRDKNQLELLISDQPGKKHALLWGYITSLAAECATAPLILPFRDYAGLELSLGTIILQDTAGHSGSHAESQAASHVGERMTGGKIVVQGRAGDYLGQEMEGGGVIASGCRDYAFRNMRGGYGVVRGDAGKFAGLGNCCGRIAVLGSCKERAGWLMSGGSLHVRGDCGEYLGILMSGGRITVKGKAGRRAGWRMKGGSIKAASYGPESAEDLLELG
ncbi:MAG: Tungsten-containing formylmethanofuran dehydrogenase 2 subunit C [Methanosaeta sp. PtaU1.Bin112]|nr:MAG: Tungsten-containing formylmethanofuran dehydrogenase 2 subunit C [Methanosaeta sp. PtaU1.Bin112]